MRAIIILLAVAMLVLVGASAVDSALGTAGDHTTNTNETWTPDAGNVTELSDSNLDGVHYDQQVTVYDENDTAMTDGTDYEWYHSNGTVKALSGGGLDGDSNATITYGYSRASALQEGVAGIFANGLNVASAMVFVLGVAVVAIGIRALGGV